MFLICVLFARECGGFPTQLGVTSPRNTELIDQVKIMGILSILSILRITNDTSPFPTSPMAFPQLLVGKVAAITGGLTGIGRVWFLISEFTCMQRGGKKTNMFQAIALDYIRHGAKVSVSHLGGEKEDALLEALRKDVNEAAKTRFLTVSGDISQPETGQNFVAKTVEAFGRLDVFVSNAGVCQFAEFLE